MTVFLIGCYLFAIVAANNIVTYMGPSGLLVTGFFLIPFDLVARDALHERWKQKRFLKMSLLIISGSYLAFLTNPATQQVSTASAVSFLISGTVDWAVYSIFWSHSRQFRMNASNAFSSVVDSVVFQIIAFGTFSAALAGSQAFFKIFGAFLWTLLFIKVMDKIQDRRI